MGTCITIISVALVIAICVIINIILDYRLHQQDNYKEIYEALDRMDGTINSMNKTIETAVHVIRGITQDIKKDE